MKYTMLLLVLFSSWMLASSTSKAQGEITYILNDGDCMQKYDYAKVGNFPETAFLDFHLTIEEGVKVVFRVRKKAGVMSKITNFSKTPVRCGTASQKIDNVMFPNDVNSGRKVVYIAEQASGYYKAYKVEKVYNTRENGDVFSYSDGKYMFQYDASRIYGENHNLRLDREGPESLVFKRMQKKGCFAMRKFQYKTGQMEDNSENVYFIEGIGFYKAEIITDAMQLMSIDKIPIDRYIKLKCSDPSTPTITNSGGTKKSSNTSSSNTKSSNNNNNNSGGIGSTDGPTGIKTKTKNTTNTSNTNTHNNNNTNSNSNGIVIYKPFVLSAGNEITSAEKKGNISPFAEDNPYDKDASLKPAAGIGVLTIKGSGGASHGGGGNPDVPKESNNSNNNNNPAPKGFHRVQEGESLYTIAEEYNTTVEKLMQLNQLGSESLDRNQLLRVNTNSVASAPYVAEDRLDVDRNLKLKVHIVRQHDTLYKIATKYKSRYNTTIQRLYELNNLKSDNLDIKQEIIVSQTPFLK
ncbi:MAG: LysM peptidoglycan-binding domain-containing protein [Aureispira sp.]|nr:LysM peptidoglycan-binding domain-containing protein [Aureispira sp.]